jgi:beta-mannosidase
MKIFLTIIPFLTLVTWNNGLQAQIQKQLLHPSWQFRKAGTNETFMQATVPGTVHTDLLSAGKIPDPYYRDHEKQLQWIGESDWVYRTTFKVNKTLLNKKHLEIVFEGLDTYAEVLLNGKPIISADNMFHPWRVDVAGLIKPENTLEVHFRSAKKITDSLAKSTLPHVIPDNPRVHARKAQYHFGWDWGPTYITCGIWKPVYLEAWDRLPEEKPYKPMRKVELIQEKDSIGRSFYFQIDGKPVYMKGANYIPSDMFATRLTRDDYRTILTSAKDAHMNMLRVWGGGIYEDDAFYELCDSLDIMVWQDFMFAGGMVPGDAHFFESVKKEVLYQVKRLRKYKSIVVWCGNNEVDEAWHNWGWQKQFNLHGEDSARVWNDYKRLFRDSIPAWVSSLDNARPYISTSPMHGWGRTQSFTEGDSHYWGVWWGLQDFEIFETKTGRFVSEYGMQAMPNLTTVYGFTQPEDRYLFSDVLKAHQKHPTGYQNLQSYLHRYFLDSNKVKNLSLEDYVYLTQCLQYYAFKNSIAIHRSNFPVNMGTLLWQLNDCWPVASWAITDYSRQPKAAWYGVKEAYRDDVMPQRDTMRPKDLPLQAPQITWEWKNSHTLEVQSKSFAKYVYIATTDGSLPQLSDNYFDLQPGVPKQIELRGSLKGSLKDIQVISLYEVLHRAKHK